MLAGELWGCRDASRGQPMLVVVQHRAKHGAARLRRLVASGCCSVLLQALHSPFQRHAVTSAPSLAPLGLTALPQVYNENIFDLLEDAPVGPGMHRAALKLKEDSQGRVFVGGLTEVRRGGVAGLWWWWGLGSEPARGRKRSGVGQLKGGWDCCILSPRSGQQEDCCRECWINTGGRLGLTPPTHKLAHKHRQQTHTPRPGQVEVTSAAEALKVLRRGSKQRQRAETGLNYSSSRSHSIFTVGQAPAPWPSWLAR